MKRTNVMIGLASLVGAALFAGSALAVPAVFSPTGHLNVRSGPGFQYPVVAQMPANTRFPVTGCIQDYSWCSVVVGSVTGWASAPYLVTDAGGKPTNLQVSGAQLGIPIVVPTAVGAVVATPPVGAIVPTPARGPADPAGAGGSFLRDGTANSTGLRRRRSDGRRDLACGSAGLSRPGVALRLFVHQRPEGAGRAGRQEDRLRRQVDERRLRPRLDRRVDRAGGTRKRPPAMSRWKTPWKKRHNIPLQVRRRLVA